MQKTLSYVGKWENRTFSSVRNTQWSMEKTLKRDRYLVQFTNDIPGKCS